MKEMIGNSIDKYIGYLLKDCLVKNSLNIVLASLISSILGFLFWMICAKLFTPEDIGRATAIFSYISLFTLLCSLGFNYSIIRYFPSGDKSSIFSTGIIISSGVSIILGLIFILNVDYISPNLSLIKSPAFMISVLIFILANNIITLSGISFIAIRQSKLYSLQNLLLSSKIVLLFPFLQLGTYGIIFAIGISLTATGWLSLILLSLQNIKFKLQLDILFVRESLKYSMGNYLSGIFTTAPNLILPIIVLNILGADNAAYYYFAYAIVSFIFLIPSAICTSLFVEGSHGESLPLVAQRSAKFSYLLLIPIILCVFFLGEPALSLIGADYALHGFDLLKLMTFSSIFFAAISLYISVQRVKKGLKFMLLLTSITSISLIALSVLFMQLYGLTGIGYAWITSYCIGFLTSILLTKYENMSTAA